jgi:hypothetical protein
MQSLPVASIIDDGLFMSWSHELIHGTTYPLARWLEYKCNFAYYQGTFQRSVLYSNTNGNDDIGSTSIPCRRMSNARADDCLLDEQLTNERLTFDVFSYELFDQLFKSISKLRFNYYLANMRAKCNFE